MLNLLIFYLKSIKTGYIWATILIGVVICSYYKGYHVASTKWKNKIQDSYIKIIDSKLVKQQEIEKISFKYQKEINNLEKKAKDIVTNLNAKHKRMCVAVSIPRNTLNKKTTRNTDISKSSFNGKAYLDEETARSLIKIAEEGDAHIEALQNIIKELLTTTREL